MNASKTKSKGNKKAKENNLSFFYTVIIVIIVAVILIPVWNNLIVIGKRDDQIAALTQERNSRRIKNDALEEKVNDPTDDEYIADIARENGYRMSNEIIFYLNPGN